MIDGSAAITPIKCSRASLPSYFTSLGISRQLSRAHPSNHHPPLPLPLPTFDVVMAGADAAFLLAFLVSAAAFAACQDSSMQQKCGQEFTKVTSCLNYATAKADAPTGACCSAVTDIRNTDAACLCFIIQQTHSGSPAVKSLGLQFDRLLQLPDACKLANSSVSNCPKLLKLSPNSPDYAIFTNSTKVTSTSISNETATVSNSNAANGVTHQVDRVGTTVVALVSTIVFSIFSVGA